MSDAMMALIWVGGIIIVSCIYFYIVNKKNPGSAESEESYKEKMEEVAATKKKESKQLDDFRGALSKHGENGDETPIYDLEGYESEYYFDPDPWSWEYWVSSKYPIFRWILIVWLVFICFYIIFGIVFDIKENYMISGFLIVITLLSLKHGYGCLIPTIIWLAFITLACFSISGGGNVSDEDVGGVLLLITTIMMIVASVLSGSSDLSDGSGAGGGDGGGDGGGGD